MKRLGLLLLSLIALQGCAQQYTDYNGVEWYSTYMDGLYSQELEQPLVVNYIILCTEGDATRNGLDFYKPDYIHTSDDADYYKNEWDKGHLAPAADYKCDQDAMDATFTYLNCALQQEKLNRTTWKYLEEFERDLTEFGDVTVTIEVDFSDSPKRVLAGAAIPEGFYKQIMVGDTMMCFWFPNKVPTSSDFRDYECDCR
jgi:endonuclease G